MQHAIENNRNGLAAGLVAAFLAFFLMIAGLASAKEPLPFKLIVHSSNAAAAAMTTKELSKVFLKKTTHWKDEKKIEVVDLGADSSVRESFSRYVHGKSVTAVKAYWQQQIFSGRATPPAELKDDAAVIEFVKSNEGAIGYVSAGADVEGLKVLAVWSE